MASAKQLATACSHQGRMVRHVPRNQLPISHVGRRQQGAGPCPRGVRGCPHGRLTRRDIMDAPTRTTGSRTMRHDWTRAASRRPARMLEHDDTSVSKTGQQNLEAMQTNHYSTMYSNNNSFDAQDDDTHTPNHFSLPTFNSLGITILNPDRKFRLSTK